MYLDEISKDNAAELAKLPMAANQCGTTVTQKNGEIKRLSVYFNCGSVEKPAYAPLEHASQLFANGEKGLDGQRRYARVCLELMHTANGQTKTARANISPYEAETLFNSNQFARLGIPPLYDLQNEMKVFGEGANAKFSSLTIRYQGEYNGKKSLMPWYIAITNGSCTAEKSPTGQVKAVSGTMVEESKLSMNVSLEEFGTIMYSCKLAMECFAQQHYAKMFAAVEKLRKMGGENA